MPQTRIGADMLRFGFVENEQPQGSIDGENGTFQLVHTPVPGSLRLYSTGLRQVEGTNFSVSGKTIEFERACRPSKSATLVADYRTEEDVD